MSRYRLDRLIYSVTPNVRIRFPIEPTRPPRTTSLVAFARVKLQLPTQQQTPFLSPTNMTDTSMEDHVYEARAVALYPPRPDAIMTLLHSPEFLPGTQTLMYSLKVSFGKCLKPNHGFYKMKPLHCHCQKTTQPLCLLLCYMTTGIANRKIWL